MDGQPGSGREITLEQLIELRAKTEALSKWLRTEIEGHLETLRPLFSPKQLLGDYIRGSEKASAKDAERNFDGLLEAYRKVAGSLSLAQKLEHPIEPIPNKLVLYPWECSHQLDGGDTVTVRSPVSWLLSFSSPIGFAEARKMAAGSGHSLPNLKAFVVHCLVLVSIFGRNPGLDRLLSALRFKSEVTRSPELGGLDMIRLTAPLPTFRPTDRLILQSVRLSGVPEFQEIVDLDAASSSLQDPWRHLLS